MQLKKKAKSEKQNKTTTKAQPSSSPIPPKKNKKLIANILLSKKTENMLFASVSVFYFIFVSDVLDVTAKLDTCTCQLPVLHS